MSVQDCNTTATSSVASQQWHSKHRTNSTCSAKEASTLSPKLTIVSGTSTTHVSGVQQLLQLSHQSYNLEKSYTMTDSMFMAALLQHVLCEQQRTRSMPLR